MSRFIERTEYNNVITVKLVIPTGCNAKCPFCFNNDKDMSCNKLVFLNNFINSLNDIICEIGDKNLISLDITGGEPTLDIELIKRVLMELRINHIHDKVCRVTMTTNGCHLLDIVDDCVGVVDYINISVHDYRYSERRKILGKNAVWFDDKYKAVTNEYKVHGITCSAVSVIYKPIENFPKWRDSFINWCRDKGFISIRFRYCLDDNFSNNEFDKYMLDTKTDTENFQTITYENTPDSHWCRLRAKDGFRVFFLHGVKDTTLYSKGIEYVIDNDGHCYCDYYKKTPIEKYDYKIGKIYDRVD